MTSTLPQLCIVTSGVVAQHSDTATSSSSSNPVDDGALLRKAFGSQLELHPFNTWTEANPCASEWDSVHCAYTDMFGNGEKTKEKRVTVVQLVDNGLTGPVDVGALRDMPLEEVVLSGNTLTGPLDMENLPPNLKSLDLWGNKFTGPAVLTGLPFSLNFLDVTTNALSGPIDLTRLPITMGFLHLASNEFTGSVDLTKLPPSMSDIHLQYNKLSGTVDLTKLPSAMIRLDLDSNDFSGRIDLTRLPDGLRFLTFSSNTFNGEVDLTKLPRDLMDLHADSNMFTGSVDLTNLPQNMKRLDIHSNRFTGSLHFQSLPEQLTYLKAKGNFFHGFDFITGPHKLKLPRTIQTFELKPAQGWESACFTGPTPVSTLNMETDVLVAASQRICKGSEMDKNHRVPATKLRGAILADDVLSASDVWGAGVEGNQSESVTATGDSLYVLLAGAPAWIRMLACAVIVALVAVGRKRIVDKKKNNRAGMGLDDMSSMDMSQSCEGGDPADLFDRNESESFVSMYDTTNFGGQGLEVKNKCE